MEPRSLARIAAFLFLSVSWAQGRGFYLPSPEELEKGSTLVCNASVESVVDTGKPATGKWVPEKRMEAKLKVLHVFKGEAAPEIVVAYRTIDWKRVNEVVDDGPQEIQLKVGGRYRFFLVPDQAPGVFLDVQWKTPDEFYAVQPLGGTERDDNPCLGSSGASKIAAAYVQAHTPAILHHLPIAWIECLPVLGLPTPPDDIPPGIGTQYIVEFNGNPSNPKESAHVVVWGDGLVDEKDSKLVER